MTSHIVHLELHAPDLDRACAFYSQLLGWRPEHVAMADATYQSLDLGPTLSGGVVECRTARALWLPYVEVRSVAATTDRALALGAKMMLAPREGPTGWRSVVTTPEGGEIALWHPKH